MVLHRPVECTRVTGNMAHSTQMEANPVSRDLRWNSLCRCGIRLGLNAIQAQQSDAACARMPTQVNAKRIHWVRASIGGFLAELTVFAIVFPARSLFGQRAFLASILVASALMPFVFAVWVCRRVESRFVLHGALVGIVAALFYRGLAWGQPQPLLYRIAHGLKILGGVAGGVVASRRKISGPGPV